MPSVVPITEARFLRLVMALARLSGWKSVHFGALRTTRGWRTPAHGDAVGFVDLVLYHPGRTRVVFAELKVRRRPPTPAQEKWAQTILDSGGDYRLWTPDDWQEIERVLTGS